MKRPQTSIKNYFSMSASVPTKYMVGRTTSMHTHSGSQGDPPKSTWLRRTTSMQIPFVHLKALPNKNEKTTDFHQELFLNVRQCTHEVHGCVEPHQCRHTQAQTHPRSTWLRRTTSMQIPFVHLESVPNEKMKRPQTSIKNYFSMSAR